MKLQRNSTLFLLLGVMVSVVIYLFFRANYLSNQIEVSPSPSVKAPEIIVTPTLIKKQIEPSAESLALIAALYVQQSEESKKDLMEKYKVEDDASLIRILALIIDEDPAKKALVKASLDKLNQQNSGSSYQPPDTSVDTSNNWEQEMQLNKQERNMKCQQEWTEYNTCLSEKNAAVSEYNTCLNESINRNSYKYGVTCFKPYNYYKICSKPFCIN